MIPFDFEYYLPTTVEEAIETFHTLDKEGKQPTYYGGGTEIISFSRLNSFFTGAVIDVKALPQCRVLDYQDDQLVIGSAVTLTSIQEAHVFPLLSQGAGRVADHTIRGKITLGGNLLSRIPYREAILALLVADASLLLAGRQGLRTLPITELCKNTVKLDKGELLLSISLNRSFLTLPFISLKHTVEGKVGYPQDKVGYPLVSMAALVKDGRLRVAVSGLGRFPFRSEQFEEQLNHKDSSREERITRALAHLPTPILADMEGSAGYREFILRNSLQEALQALEGA
jgi:CO/xanthine dehydrogenase FAD-binding subunit